VGLEFVNILTFFKDTLPSAAEAARDQFVAWEIHNTILLQIPQNLSSSRVESTKPCSEAVELSKMKIFGFFFGCKFDGIEKKITKLSKPQNCKKKKTFNIYTIVPL
jgi:hypothetical protein